MYCKFLEAMYKKTRRIVGKVTVFATFHCFDRVLGDVFLLVNRNKIDLKISKLETVYE